MKRPTPKFDRWLVATERQLARHGAKAELARFLAKSYGRPARSWESNLAKIMGGNLLPNAEILLAITDWVARRPAGKRERRRKA